MKLASLAYEIVRDAIENQGSINEIGFVRGDYDNDREYSSQISFAFNYINLGLTRLVTERKTLLKTTQAISDESGYIEFTDGEITAVVDSLGLAYERVGFAHFSNGIAVEKKYVSKALFIEYRPAIPRFSIESIRELVAGEDNVATNVEKVINLEDYGVTDEMCSYVKEYAKGGLMEYLSPELSSRHVQMAENYISKLKTRYTEFPVRKVEDNIRGGGAF